MFWQLLKIFAFLEDEKLQTNALGFFGYALFPSSATPTYIRCDVHAVQQNEIENIYSSNVVMTDALSFVVVVTVVKIARMPPEFVY